MAFDSTLKNSMGFFARAKLSSAEKKLVFAFRSKKKVVRC